MGTRRTGYNAGGKGNTDGEICNHKFINAHFCIDLTLILSSGCLERKEVLYFEVVDNIAAPIRSTQACHFIMSGRAGLTRAHPISPEFLTCSKFPSTARASVMLNLCLCSCSWSFPLFLRFRAAWWLCDRGIKSKWITDVIKMSRSWDGPRFA